MILQRYLHALIIVIFMLHACNSNHPDAVRQAELIRSVIKEHTPGSLATSESGYYMKARIDGKQWLASHMMPDESANSSYVLIQGENGEADMHFQLWKRGLATGKIIAFSDDRAASLSIRKDDNFLGGTTGQVEITKMDNQWLEGSFRFTATSGSSGSRAEVTQGIFRVPYSEAATE